MNMLKGHVALVTGTSGTGIGHGTAQALAAAGATVIATARSLDAAREVAEALKAEGGTALPVALDTASSQSCRAAIEATIAEYGRLDIVVHSAAHGYSSGERPVADVDAEWWDSQAAVSLAGSFYLAREAFPHLKASGRGRLILFTSIRGIAGIDLNPAYAVQKAAVRGMTRALAHEWGPHGITVNVVTPAAMSKPTLDFFAANPGAREHVEATFPLRRIGDPRHDIGAAIAAIAGPAGQYLTGQTIALDGGIFTGT